MATSEEVAVKGSDKEPPPPPTQEDAVREQPSKTPERRHVDALLDISEEEFFRELEPYEYHCYSGWEEAVQGWGRVAPLSCILLTQKRYKKPKHKEADNPAPVSVDPAVPNEDSASTAAHRCEPRVGPQNSFKKSMLLNQDTGSWSNTAVAALQKDASEWHVLSVMRKNTSNLLLEEKIDEDGTLRETPLQTRSTKPQKNRNRSNNNAVVPIKNFTFLPPIKSPHLNHQRVSGQLCRDKRAPEDETLEENCPMFDKKGGTRGTRVDPVIDPDLSPAALTSKYWTCQHNPHLFSAVSVSIPKRYQVPPSSKRDTVHRTSFSMGKSLAQALHSGTATGAQAHMRPSKTVCAVKLYEGCEINV